MFQHILKYLKSWYLEDMKISMILAGLVGLVFSVENKSNLLGPYGAGLGYAAPGYGLGAAYGARAAGYGLV